MKLGAQLYSVKDEMEQDVFQTLEQIASMGYTGVEFAGYYDIPAYQMKQALDRYRLSVYGAHVPIERLEHHLQEELDYSIAIGNPYLICPFALFEKGKEDIDHVVSVLNHAASVCKAHDIAVGYHNHAQEFVKVNGTYILDWMMQQTTDVVFELDVFWLAVAGIDPIAYIKQCGNRVELIHLKQISELPPARALPTSSDQLFAMLKGDFDKNVTFPEGVLDLHEIVATAADAKYFIVEQESGGTDTLEAMRIDAAHMLQQTT